MEQKLIGKMQLGKQGLTESFIGNLKRAFKTHKNMKISVLKSACRDRSELKEMNEKILSELGPKYTSRVIGFTLNVKKWRKAKE